MHYSNNELERNYNNNYPDELEFKKENKDSCKASFLDLKSKSNKSPWQKIYNKVV